jgi:putative alpha-1,2-mannosidase
MQPNTMSDVDGRYINTNFEQCQMPPGEVYHSTFSLWDTFRAAHPLYTLIAPDIAAQFVRDMVRHHQTYGYLPIWDLWGQDNYCMIGNHAIPVLADAIMADLPGIDAEAAYQAMVESSTRSHFNSPFEIWEQYGYMPQTLQNTSVSITMEQSFDDSRFIPIAPPYELFRTMLDTNVQSSAVDATPLTLRYTLGHPVEFSSNVHLYKLLTPLATTDTPPPLA